MPEVLYFKQCSESLIPNSQCSTRYIKWGTQFSPYRCLEDEFAVNVTFVQCCDNKTFVKFTGESQVTDPETNSGN